MAITDESLPPCLQKLKNATTFDDGMVGDGERSPNHDAYEEASTSVQGLESSALEYVLKTGTPAGRLYAAVLLKQSSRVGDEQSFGKLLNDDEKVVYRSGCKRGSYTVRQIAQAFIKDGHFNNFRFSMFCKLKAPVSNQASDASHSTPTDIDSHVVTREDKQAALNSELTQSMDTLMNARSVDHFQQGDSNRPARAWSAFQFIKSQGKAARPGVDQLLKSENGASRIYGAILLMQIDAPSAVQFIKTQLTNQTPLVFSNGCSKEQTTAGALFKRILTGEQLVLLEDPVKH